jgi:NTE family protein
VTRRPRIGVALGSGGARGWAHIGVLDALREAGIDIHCVAGASMGALVGAAFAAGRLADLRQVAVELDWKRVLGYFAELSLSGSGLIDGRKIRRFLSEYVGAINIERLTLPYAAVATDIETGREVVLRAGNVVEAVRASISIPGLFTPGRRDGAFLVDGGLVNPIPVSVARALGADAVIAVDVVRAPLPVRREDAVRRPRFKRPRGEIAAQLFDAIEIRIADLNLRRAAIDGRRGGAPGIIDVFGNAARIVQRQIADMRLEREPPDVLIQPDVQNISTMDFHRAAEAISAGRAAVAPHLPSLRRLARADGHS